MGSFKIKNIDKSIFFIRYFLYIHFKCYPKSSLYPPPTLIPKPPTPASWPWPCIGAYNVCNTKGSLFPVMANQAIFCHICSQRHMLWGVLIGSYCCSTYRLADPFSSLGAFSSFSIGCPVFHLIADCEHPLLYLPGTGRASQEAVISGSYQQTLIGIHNSFWFWWLLMGWIPRWGGLCMDILLVSALNFVSVNPSMDILFPLLRRI